MIYVYMQVILTKQRVCLPCIVKEQQAHEASKILSDEGARYNSQGMHRLTGGRDTADSARSGQLHGDPVALWNGCHLLAKKL